MINKQEISRLANEKKVRTSTIDKDWALGHFIDAVFSIPECRRCLVFKGGTFIKKCLFPDYRFSEDIDFTSTSETFVLDRTMLDQMIALVISRTELPLHVQSFENLYFNDRLTGSTPLQRPSYRKCLQHTGLRHSRGPCRKNKSLNTAFIYRAKRLLRYLVLK